MRYGVEWIDDAEEDLSDIWTAARDRARVTQACDDFEHAVEMQPLDVGESREDDLRIAHVSPLGFHFRVIQDQRVVIVLSVWRTDLRRK